MIDLMARGEEILAEALAHGGDFAEIFLEETTAASIRFEEGKVERVVSGADIGAGIRLLAGDRTFYAHTNDVSLNGLLKAAKTVASGMSETRRPCACGFKPERFVMPVQIPPPQIETAKKTALAASADRAARAYDPRIVQVAAMYADSMRRAVILNSEGRFVEYLRPQIMLIVQAVAAQRDVIQTGYHAVGGTLGYELFDAEDPEAVARAAAREACLMLDAAPAPTGPMPIVLSSEAGGTLIHEAVGHGLEADLIEKQMSKYCGRLGEMIAAPGVTVVDDGTLPRFRGSCPVDDEGTPCQRTVLVDQGRLVRFVNDLRTARKLGHAPTGNGRRESYQSKPLPRMTNTFIAPGAADPQDILASTDRGLYVRKMGGGQVNTLNGEFVFEVSEGYLIVNGKAETPVRGATLIGNGPEVLNHIDAVGSDLGFRVSTCGKHGQAAPITCGQPTIRIRELTVGGTASAL